MARFLGAVQGSRGEASRLGSNSSGIRAQAQGWDCGVTVYGESVIDSHSGKSVDQFEIYATGGSNGRSHRKLVATIVETDTGFQILYPNPTSS